MRGTRSNEAQPNYHRQGLSRYLLQIASPPPYSLNLVRFSRGRTSSIITGNPYLLGIDRIQIPRSEFLRQEIARKLFLFFFFFSLSSTIFRREIYLAPLDFLFSQSWKSLNPHCEQDVFKKRDHYFLIFFFFLVCKMNSNDLKIINFIFFIVIFYIIT